MIPKQQKQYKVVFSCQLDPLARPPATSRRSEVTLQWRDDQQLGGEQMMAALLLKLLTGASVWDVHRAAPNWRQELSVGDLLLLLTLAFFFFSSFLSPPSSPTQDLSLSLSVSFSPSHSA